MKKCYMCKQLLELALFAKDKTRSTGYSSSCKPCSARYQKERRAAAQKIIRAAKEVPCVDCGLVYPYYVMDLDHLPQYEKSFNLAMTTKPIEEIEKEIKKCEAVCSNCHRLRTHNRGYKGGRTYKSML